MLPGGAAGRRERRLSPRAPRAAWDPDRYLRFEAARARPARDLIARIEHAGPAAIVDLGCGPGNVTALLAARWPAARITGLDASADMLARARACLPEATWIEDDIADWTPAAPVDLVFSNAALHWLPDHGSLFPRLVAALAPGGVLAVQMPDSFGLAAHRIVADVVASGPWRDRIGDAGGLLADNSPVGPPEFWYDLLAPLTGPPDIWRTTYLHVLEGDNPVLDWVRGTALRPVLARLEPAEQTAFLDLCGQRLQTAHPARADGRTLLPFRRLFILATRPD